MIFKNKLDFDGSWTLFLDRDGVINEKLPNAYVSTWSEFRFIKHVKDALQRLNQLFDKTIIVTNQQGIGKELMTHEDLQYIHESMMVELEQDDINIDLILYCPFLAVFDPPCRKPNPGMALEAKSYFPNINFKKSVMIGDSESDILFGKNLGMFTIKIGRDRDFYLSEADASATSLRDVVDYIGHD